MFIKSPKVASEVLWALLLYMVRFERVGFVRSIVRFEEFRFVWVTVRLFPARSKVVMLNSTLPSAWLAFTITLAFAIWPVMFIAYVEFKSMISALERFSFAVIVMFRASPKVASDVSCVLLLYMVRFERVGFVRSIVRFEEFRFVWVLLSQCFLQDQML